MIHITLTGIYSGVPVCTVNREEAIKKGDKFFHIGNWINDEKMRKDICPICLEAFLDERELEA